MDPRIIGYMATQEGLVTRRQLLELDVLPEEIDRRVRGGGLVLVRRGVYARPDVWAANDRWDQRQVLVDRAASLATTRPHVWSHDSAALRLSMQILKQDGRSHLTHAGRRGSHTRAGVTHHHAPYAAAELDLTRQSLGMARVALDIAREHGIRAGTCAVDSALRLGATCEELQFSLERMKHWPGVSHARAALALSDPDTDSIAETLGRELVEELGYGRPQTQFGLTADGRVVWCDLRLHRHLFEVDGLVKLIPVAEGGLAADPVEALRDEKSRQDFVTGFKTGMSRIVWGDFWGAQREQAKARLDREYRDTCSRFGTDIGDLAAFRPRQPRRRPSPVAA